MDAIEIYKKLEAVTEGQNAEDCLLAMQFLQRKVERKYHAEMREKELAMHQRNGLNSSAEKSAAGGLYSGGLGTLY